MSSVILVFCGAGLGALLRWFLSLTLNPVFPTLPLGTLAANLIGGLLVGVAITLLQNNGDLPPETRLFLVTGFLGGLTTFSTFSAEVVTLFVRGQYLWATVTSCTHLIGSLAMTALGLAATTYLLSLR